jgi:hypothetical protein
MTSEWDDAGSLVGGPLRDAGAPWPLTLTAVLCDLRPRFLPKGMAERGHRAVSRNGRVLLCSDRPLAARVRLQTWNRAALPGEPPAPHGVLLCVQVGRAAGLVPAVSAETAGTRPATRPDAVYQTRLAAAGGGADLTLDVGGLQALEFHRIAPWTSTSTATSAKAAPPTPS